MSDSSIPVSVGRTSGRLRKGVIALGVLLVLLIAAAVVVPLFLDQQKYKELIQDKVAEATGYQVDWKGDIGLSLFPLPGAELHEVTVANGKQDILKLREASIKLALMPLLSGQVQVNSIELDNPDVTLLTDKQGNPTWVSAKLGKPAGESSAPTDCAAADCLPQPGAEKDVFSIDLLKVNEGRLTLMNEQTGKKQVIESLTASIRAESVTGPFSAKGSLTYAGKKLEFDTKAGKLDGNQKNYPVGLKLALPEAGVEADYAGVIGVGDELVLDGELTVAAEDFRESLGVLTGSRPELPKEISGGFDLKGKVFFDGKVASLSNLRLGLGDFVYAGEIKVSGLKDAVPVLSLDLQSQTESRSPSSGLSATLGSLGVKGDGTYVKGKVTIDNGVLLVNGQKISLEGSFVPAEGKKRPVIDVAVRAERIDLDALRGEPQKQAGKAQSDTEAGAISAPPSKQSLQGQSMPFDGHLRAEIGILMAGGKSYKPLRVDLTSNGNAVKISSLTIGVMDGATLSAKGSIGNLRDLSGLNLEGAFRAADADSLLQQLKISKPAALTRKIGEMALSGTIKGDVESLDFNGTLAAMRFAVSGTGTVGTPLATPKIDSLALKIQHPQLTDAIQVFQPGFVAPSSFTGSLDLAATLAVKGEDYRITGLKGMLGSTSVSGDLAVANGGAKPEISGALTFGALAFDATGTGKGGGKSSTKGSESSSAAATGGERWSSAPINSDWMNAFNADLTIKAGAITQSYWKLAKANLAFSLKDGELTVRDLSADMFGGSVLMNGTAKAGKAVSFNLAMKAKNVDARQLQSALTSKPSDTLNGIIDSFTLDLASTGPSVAALVQGLSGAGKTEGRNLIIKGLDLAQLAETAKGSFKPLERAGSLFTTFQNGQTQFDTFMAEFPIDKGNVNFSRLVFDGPRAGIEGRGTVNLPRWTIDLKNTVTVKGTDIPPFDITIRGPLDNPVKTGGSVIEDYLRSKAQKKIEKLLTRELEKRFGGGEPAAPAADGTPPPVSDEEKAIDALKNLLGQ